MTVFNHYHEEITCLVLPLSDRRLLMPTNLMVEIITYRTASPPPNGSPHWVIGIIEWRGEQVPLLSFEGACGGQAELTQRSHIAIIHALGDQSHLKYMALVTKGVPVTYQVDRTLTAADQKLGPLEKTAVHLDVGIAKIPDLMALEQKLMPVFTAQLCE